MINEGDKVICRDASGATARLTFFGQYRVVAADQDTITVRDDLGGNSAYSRSRFATMEEAREALAPAKEEPVTVRMQDLLDRVTAAGKMDQPMDSMQELTSVQAIAQTVGANALLHLNEILFRLADGLEAQAGALAHFNEQLVKIASSLETIEERAGNLQEVRIVNEQGIPVEIENSITIDNLP